MTKTETKWTPGPWTVQGEGKGFVHISSESSTHPRIAEVCKRFASGQTIETWEESKANARLIAKAPEMAELLHRASRELARGGFPERWDIVNEIRKLLEEISK